MALDPADRLVTAYSYDPVGNVAAVAVREGAAGPVVRLATHTYSAARHWLEGVENTVAAGAVAGTFAYTRRADGQVTRVVDATAQPGGGSVARVIGYGYDALNRLTAETERATEAGPAVDAQLHKRHGHH